MSILQPSRRSVSSPVCRSFIAFDRPETYVSSWSPTTSTPPPAACTSSCSQRRSLLASEDATDAGETVDSSLRSMRRGSGSCCGPEPWARTAAAAPSAAETLFAAMVNRQSRGNRHSPNRPLLRSQWNPSRLQPTKTELYSWLGEGPGQSSCSACLQFRIEKWPTSNDSSAHKSKPA